MSFFLTNIMGSPHGDKLGRIYPLSSNYCNCILNSVNSGILIRYRTCDTSDDPGIKSIVKSKSRLGGNIGISKGNTS